MTRETLVLTPNGGMSDEGEQPSPSVKSPHNMALLISRFSSAIVDVLPHAPTPFRHFSAGQKPGTRAAGFPAFASLTFKTVF